MSGMIDRFVHDRMPPGDQWPVMDYGVLPELAAYPGRLNCGVELLDRMVETGFSERPVLTCEGAVGRYAELLERSNRIVRVLVEDMGVQPGNRVLLRGANTPMMIACWFAAVKAGAVVVATMPLLRARELSFLLEKAGIDHALCEESLAGALDEAASASGRRLDVRCFTALGDGDASLDRAMTAKPSETAEALQAYVKSEIAPYKYPRIIRFVDALPKTPTGKLQRFRLRDGLSHRKAGETS